MNIPIDAVNSAMNFAGGILALVAAILAIVGATLPKEKAAAAIANLRAKTISFTIVGSAISSAISAAAFDSPSVALFFILICASLTSIQFLRGKEPATRVETFMLIIQITILLAFFIMHMLLRIISVIERLA